MHGDDPYALYHWWLRQIGRIEGGHRYFYLMCLAIYAYKCDVPKEKLRQDMRTAFEDLQMVKHENALTEEDIRSALEAYDREYYNFTIVDIEKLTNVRIERNNGRNGRTQCEHLGRASCCYRHFDDPAGSWRNKEGDHRHNRKYMNGGSCIRTADRKECIAGTGLSKNTVYKWWDNPPTVRYEGWRSDGQNTPVTGVERSDTGGFAKGAVNATERPLRRFLSW